MNETVKTHTPLPWENVESEVTAAIKKATGPLLLKAADDFYGALLDATQDYLCENITYNIAARISVAERQALSDRQDLERERDKTADLVQLAHQYASDLRHPPSADSVERRLERIAAVLAKVGA